MLRWVGSQSRAISSPESYLWEKSLGRQKKKNPQFMSYLSAVSWKGKHSRKHLYPEWQWQQAVKEKYPFSELSEEWKFGSWIWRSCGNQTSRLNEITTAQSLSEHLLCKGSERQYKKQVKSKVNYWHQCKKLTGKNERGMEVQ